MNIFFNKIREMSKFVKVYYGPYESHGTVKYKTQRLFATKEKLLKLGYRLCLKKAKKWDFCIFVIKHKDVFCCKITNLQFNSIFKNDPVGLRAVKAVVDASQRMQKAEDYFWICQFIKSMFYMAFDYSYIYKYEDFNL